MAQHPLVLLRDYWHIIRQQRGIVLFTAFMLGFFSFIIANVWKPDPIYKAASKVQINSPQTTTGSSTAAQLDTLRSVITSSPVIRATAERLKLFAYCHPDSESKACRSDQDSTKVVLGLQAMIATRQEGPNIISIEATNDITVNNIEGFEIAEAVLVSVSARSAARQEDPQ